MCFMSDYPFTRRMVQDMTECRIIAPDKPFHVVNYAYAIAPGQPARLGTENQFVRNQQRSAACACWHSAMICKLIDGDTQ